MFGFSRSRRPAVRRTHLFLESLDARLLPDATPIAPPLAAAASQATSNGTNADPKSTAPVITSFGAAEVGKGWYLFTGHVTGRSLKGAVISFGGAPVSLQGLTTTLDENGDFSLLVQMKTDGSDDGTATAVCTVNGVQSNVAMTYVNPSQ